MIPICGRQSIRFSALSNTTSSTASVWTKTFHKMSTSKLHTNKAHLDKQCTPCVDKTVPVVVQTHLAKRASQPLGAPHPVTLLLLV
jgi:hypothetical protein